MVISSEGLDCCGRGVIFFLHSGTITVKDLGEGREEGGGRGGRKGEGRGGREVYRREREKGNRYELRYIHMYMHTTQA